MAPSSDFDAVAAVRAAKRLRDLVSAT